MISNISPTLTVKVGFATATPLNLLGLDIYTLLVKSIAVPAEASAGLAAVNIKTMRKRIKNTKNSTMKMTRSAKRKIKSKQKRIKNTTSSTKKRTRSAKHIIK